MSSPQIQNALQTVNRLVPLVEDAERHFKSARNWSFLDVLGGGFLTDLVKYHKLNKASDSMNEINYLMQKLSRELGIARLNIIKNMKKLQENNIIRRIGATKNGHWEIVEEKDES